MSTRAVIKPVIGKYQSWFRVLRSLDKMFPPGWFVLDVAFLKFVELPQPGEMILRKHWRGVWIRFAFWIPFDRP